MRAATLGALLPVVLCVGLPRVARGDAPAEPQDRNDTLLFKPRVGKDIVVETPEDRTPGNIAMLAGLAGGGAVLGGLGLYFHLDSRTESNKVTAHVSTARPWLPSDQVAVDAAASDRTKAIVFYGVGGALIIGAVVALIVTDPGTTTTIIHPHTAVAPTPGGAIVARMWSF